jgi:hypothetical protein
MTLAIMSTKALYSASLEEQAIVRYLPDFHEIGVWPKKTW